MRSALVPAAAHIWRGNLTVSGRNVSSFPTTGLQNRTSGLRSWLYGSWRQSLRNRSRNTRDWSRLTGSF